MRRIDSDLTVVGGGIAGITAALAAARHGLHVALVQDREVLGGNISSECQAGFGGGAVNTSFYGRESGISDEIKQALFHANPRYRNKEDYYLIDDTLLQIVRSEPNISLFLGCVIFEVETVEQDGNRQIASASGFRARTQETIRFSGPLFLDASGDGILGCKSGADYREGRESRSEFGESLAPETADSRKMGSCILFNVAKADHPVPFVKPAFAYDYEKDGILAFANRPATGRELPSRFDGMTGLWWLSYGGEKDTVRDAYEIDWELKKLVYGYWDYVKNSGKYPGTENYYLSWVAPYAAKRESKRFLGDYIMSERDIREGIRHEDDVSSGGWSLDCHDPGGIYGEGPVSLFGSVPALYGIPYRCMYSRNVENLFLSGRIVSATHIALGSLRVVQTLAAMAQAAGSAAVLCAKYRCLPRDVALTHIDELRRILQRDGQYIPGIREDCGEASAAVITASSVKRLENTDTGRLIPLSQPYCLCIPTEQGRVDSLELFVQNRSDSPQMFRYEIWDGELAETYLPDSIRMSGEISLEAGQSGWIRLDARVYGLRGKKAYIFLPVNPDISAASATYHITGAPTFGRSGNHLFRCGENIAFRRVLPDENLYAAENVTNGFSRPVGVPNMWSAQSNCEEYLHFSFPDAVSICETQIVFNGQFWKNDLNVGELMDQLIPSFDIIYLLKGSIVRRTEVRENYQPLYKEAVPEIACDSVHMVFHTTQGSPFIEVFSVKFFSKGR